MWVSWGYDVYDAVIKYDPDFIVNKPDEVLDLISSIFPSQGTVP